MTKASVITTEMVNIRVAKILELSINPDTDFELTLMIKQLSNWSKAKRRQVFRGVLKKLIGGSSSNWHSPVTAYLKTIEVHQWSVNTDFIKYNALNRVIKIIKQMEEKERFIPEKVFTLNKIPLHFFGNDPEVIEYLISKNIMVLSKNLKISSGDASLLKTAIQSIQFLRYDLANIKNTYIKLNLNPFILLDANKMKLIVAIRIMKNMNIIADYFQEMELNAAEKSFLNSCVQILFKTLGELNKPFFRLARYSSKASILVVNERISKHLDHKLLTEEEAFSLSVRIEADLMNTANKIYKLLNEQETTIVSDVETSFNPYTITVAIR